MPINMENATSFPSTERQCSALCSLYLTEIKAERKHKPHYCRRSGGWKNAHLLRGQGTSMHR